MNKLIIDVMLVTSIIVTYWLYGCDFERGLSTGILSTIVLFVIMIRHTEVTEEGHRNDSDTVHNIE